MYACIYYLRLSRNNCKGMIGTGIFITFPDLVQNEILLNVIDINGTIYIRSKGNINPYNLTRTYTQSIYIYIYIYICLFYLILN